ncbi:ribosomal protein S18 acetylase RimI-like enzyme [Salirhabdus euzebyi]|uniref:Ribosomal protein S18 acetylase RimI-like enzyme n=1 Tax=Salirhabdus euzebyi TaxID=394506 RepID=A0A841Q4R1_9BACI|nr:GNAT family N-acetyltransferase [Salirhabdus euzebyi]MBB6453332.1 ribosomal protein S18 acetylase RimI-like enzyme [Salirhabdus euzebyi]
MGYIVRKATKNDFEQINRLGAQLHELHSTNRSDLYAITNNPIEWEYFMNFLEGETTYLYVAVDTDKNKLIGHTFLREEHTPDIPVLVPRKILYMNILCVDDTYRGKGIGRLLFDYTKQLAKEIKADAVELDVSSFNVNAVKFYESLGLTEKSKRMELPLY